MTAIQWQGLLCFLEIQDMDTVQVLLQTPRRNIALLCSIIGGYEGVAVLRTVNPAQGLLELLVAPAFRATALTLLHALAEEMELSLIDPGDPIPTSGQ
jgi:hypothetical protein